ncbi:MAG: SlyX family protein [Halomonadaceae bacterium]|nr:MAG: SlyX family protein [Halomonadaceae bacterium]
MLPRVHDSNAPLTTTTLRRQPMGEHQATPDHPVNSPDTDRRELRLEQRLDALETQATFQEELLSTLNDQVSHQQLALNRLWDANRLLQDQLKSLQSGSGQPQESPDDAPPPHY